MTHLTYDWQLELNRTDYNNYLIIIKYLYLAQYTYGYDLMRSKQLK